MNYTFKSSDMIQALGIRQILLVTNTVSSWTTTAEDGVDGLVISFDSNAPVEQVRTVLAMVSADVDSLVAAQGDA